MKSFTSELVIIELSLFLFSLILAVYICVLCDRRPCTNLVNFFVNNIQHPPSHLLLLLLLQDTYTTKCYIPSAPEQVLLLLLYIYLTMTTWCGPRGVSLCKRISSLTQDLSLSGTQ